MAKHSHYTVAQVAPGHYHVVKYDGVLGWEETFYAVHQRGNRLTCDCQAAKRPTCRHRDLVQIFANMQMIGSGKKYNYDKREWL